MSLLPELAIHHQLVNSTTSSSLFLSSSLLTPLAEPTRATGRLTEQTEDGKRRERKREKVEGWERRQRGRRRSGADNKRRGREVRVGDSERAEMTDCRGRSRSADGWQVREGHTYTKEQGRREREGGRSGPTDRTSPQSAHTHTHTHTRGELLLQCSGSADRMLLSATG